LLRHSVFRGCRNGLTGLGGPFRVAGALVIFRAGVRIWAAVKVDHGPPFGLGASPCRHGLGLSLRVGCRVVPAVPFPEWCPLAAGNPRFRLGLGGCTLAMFFTLPECCHTGEVMGGRCQTEFCPARNCPLAGKGKILFDADGGNLPPDTREGGKGKAPKAFPNPLRKKCSAPRGRQFFTRQPGAARFPAGAFFSADQSRITRSLRA